MATNKYLALSRLKYDDNTRSDKKYKSGEEAKGPIRELFLQAIDQYLQIS